MINAPYYIMFYSLWFTWCPLQSNFLKKTSYMWSISLLLGSKYFRSLRDYGTVYYSHVIYCMQFVIYFAFVCYLSYLLLIIRRYILTSYPTALQQDTSSPYWLFDPTSGPLKMAWVGNSANGITFIMWIWA